MTGRRPLTKSELELWRRSTADVLPLANTHEAEKPRKPAHKAKPAKPIDATEAIGSRRPKRLADARSEPPASPVAPQKLDPKRPVDIDRRSWERLKRGQVRIERRLDLHGRTQTEAHEALDRFLVMASAVGLRCVLVVTGKGRADGQGVLRQMVPRWLGEAGNRNQVLTYCPAQPRHGGDGALYVLLRRRRDGDGR